MRTTPIAAGIAFLVSLLVLVGITYVLLAPPPTASPPTGTPSVELDIKGGEFDSSFGFGDPKTSVGSPGPEIHVQEGEVVKVTFRNIGQIPHSFKIVKEKKWDAPTLFGAFIGDATRPLSANQAGTTTFKADKTGTYYYICTVPGHVERGMFGTIVVEPKW